MTHKARVLALLSDGCWHSHNEGYELGVMLHSRVADLRKDGYTIECSKDGRRYRYRLLGRPPADADQDGGLPNSTTLERPLAQSPVAEPLFDLGKAPAWA